MIQASRTLNAIPADGVLFSISIEMSQIDSDFAENDDGSSSEIYRAVVEISSISINSQIRVFAEDIFVLMYRAMRLTHELLSAEAERLSLTIFQQNPGDADGPLGLFTVG